MKRLAEFLMILVIFSACKKEDVINEDASFVSVINTVAGEEPLSLSVDTGFRFRLPYRASYRNLPITPGSHIISIEDSGRTKTFLTLSPQEYIPNTSSTIVLYETLHPVDSTVRGIRLSDDLTLAPNGFVKVRFIHAAPLLVPVDVTFLRTNQTPMDSFTLSSQRFIGTVMNMEALSAFNNIPLGNYTLKVKSAGTQDTLLNTVRLSVSNLAGAGGITGITTFYLSGGVRGEALQVGSFRHYP